jgi:hypothetical protein
MRMQSEVECGGKTFAEKFGQVPEGYNSTKFRREVQDAVTGLSTEGFALDNERTFDEAAKVVAGRYGVSKERLSWTAHRTDLMQKRGQQWMKFWREALEKDAEPALPGLEEYVKIPQSVLIEDEEVVLGDPRLTLAVLIAQTQLASEISAKESAAHLLRADQLHKEHERFDKLCSDYKRIVEINPYHLGAEDLVYDRQKKGFVPRKGATGGA